MAEEHHEEHKSHGGGGHGGHGGGGHAEGEHEGAPEWLISFADNVALMMGFFVIMLAMAMNKVSESSGSTGESSDGSGQPSPAMMDMAIGMREAFNNPVSAENPADAMLWKRVQQKQAESEARAKSQKGNDRDVRSIRKSDYYGMGGVVSFATGSAEIDPESRAAILDILKNRKGLRNIIEILGHTSAAEAFDLPDRGMQLSLQRASAVAKVLVENGIGWNQLRLMGMADTDRVAVRTYDAAGHRANQRVEIIESQKSMQGDDGETEEGNAEKSADHGDKPKSKPTDKPAAHAEKNGAGGHH